MPADLIAGPWAKLAAMMRPDPRVPATQALRAQEEKASRAGPLIALQLQGRPVWTPRDYAALAREGFARNAVVQGAAAELFKAWAATVRSACRPLDAQIVLCLHDELLVHAPQGAAADVVELLHRTLADVGRRWAPPAQASRPVRFVADVAVVHRWSEAKS